jgi:glycosyltransferase
MKVSIITVSYNSAKTIEDAIKSVLSQNYQDIEYIIIDGGSIDGTIEIVKKYRDKIAKFISEPDKGIYDAMNKGIKLAKGDIVGILNSDDFYADDNVIKNIVEAMEKEGVDVCWGDLVYVQKKDVSKIVRYWKSSEYRPGKFKKGWHPPHPAFFVRRSAYGKYGYFNLNFKIAADYELMLRILEKYKVKSCYIPKLVVKMRAGGQSNFKNIFTVIKANFEVYKSWQLNGLQGGLWAAFLKPLSKIKQLFENSLNKL